ncbi:phosphopantothenoylcysteine decarboxylase subunit VHS3-like, partial [Mizuhopecten yessoensis]|uniref:phosphopantothenoylcysteine decarboxylase subunit VHS3-like n=1 Tax=Mizuhopecten yessoensis TaxID=6573 RepID=UPI000B45D3CD
MASESGREDSGSDDEEIITVSGMLEENYVSNLLPMSVIRNAKWLQPSLKLRRLDERTPINKVDDECIDDDVDGFEEDVEDEDDERTPPDDDEDEDKDKEDVEDEDDELTHDDDEDEEDKDKED